MSEPSLFRAWRTPAALAALSIGGLVLALVAEGAADIAALLLIALPLVVLARKLVIPPTSTR